MSLGRDVAKFEMLSLPLYQSKSKEEDRVE